jgi:hypothetical protein
MGHGRHCCNRRASKEKEEENFQEKEEIIDLMHL